ncbi:hypothetical protein [Peptostreptococcus anaerobius]|nr:hypothetical protein [Peptostreptococcus anaerobius]
MSNTNFRSKIMIVKYIDNSKEEYQNVTDIKIEQPWIDGGYLSFYQSMERIRIPLKTVRDYKVEEV